MAYACKDRAPFAQSIQVADGWENTWARRMVDMQFRMDPSCIYSTSELGEKDEKCHGCKWKAGAGTGSPAEPVQVGDSLADLQQGEGGPSGIGGQADVGGVADVAEQRGASEQARAAEKLEALYPGAAIYRQVKE